MALERYRPERLVARSQMAEVWQALDLETGCQVAIKRLLVESEQFGELRDRLLREAEVLRQLSHPAIVGCLDLGHDARGPYLVLEWLVGEDLASRTRRDPLPLGLQVELIRQLLSALAVCHQRGILHRDLKPSNLFLTAGDRGPAVKILDFGVAGFCDQVLRLTRTGTVIGTPTYLAPERIRDGGVVDHRADLYSVGVVLYELTTGRPPFEGASLMAVLRQIIGATPPLPSLLRPEIPEPLESAILRAMRRAPADRFSSAEEMAAALSGG